MADAVGEPGLEADLAGRVHLGPGLPLHLGLHPDLPLQLNDLMLLHPAERKQRLGFKSSSSVTKREMGCVENAQVAQQRC